MTMLPTARGERLKTPRIRPTFVAGDASLDAPGAFKILWTASPGARAGAGADAKGSAARARNYSCFAGLDYQLVEISPSARL